MHVKGLGGYIDEGGVPRLNILDVQKQIRSIPNEEAHRASASLIFYNNEQALRSVIRIAYISCIDEFLKIEELPSGHGYPVGRH